MFGWILLAVIAGIWIGVELSKIFHAEMIKKILKDIGVSTEDLARAHQHIQQQLADSKPATEVNINVEQHSGHYYAFRKETDEFLAQGPDYVNLLTALQQKLGNNTVVNLDYEVAKTMKGSQVE
jgi:hypothetical protein